MSWKARGFFFLGVPFLAFLAGFTTYHFQVFPYSLLRELGSDLVALKELAGFGRPHHLFPRIYDESGVTVRRDAELSPGVTLITGYLKNLDWKPGLSLIDSRGRVLHEWSADPLNIGFAPEGRAFASSGNSYVHGSYLLPDGDILFNLEYLGLVRMGPCGEIRWHSDYATHHSIAVTEDGNFWVPGNIAVDPSALDQFPGLRAPLYEDRLYLVSEDGELLKDISVATIVFANNLQRYITKAGESPMGDVFHVNDIAPFPSDLEGEYGDFTIGDIVVSLRNLHLVLILDPETLEVKWYSDDFIGQHDPDFIGNGLIGVFDNNRDGTPRGGMSGGSRIVAISVFDNDKTVLYQGSSKHPFYTSAGGKWQYLENGNALIIEARAGRVFEVNPSGRIVWEWIQEPYDEKLVPEVLGATRYVLSDAQSRALAGCGKRD